MISWFTSDTAFACPGVEGALAISAGVVDDVGSCRMRGPRAGLPPKPAGRRDAFAGGTGLRILGLETAQGTIAS